MLETLSETYRTWTLLRNLRSNVRRPPEELTLIQDKLLRAVVLNAYRNVPFYRRFWKEMGFDPRRFRGIRDLELIPVANSSLVKKAERQGDLLAENIDKNRCTYLDSSGSSDNPLRIWKRPIEERVRRAVGLRIWFEHGFRWSHMTAQFQILPGPSHILQRLGISPKLWISTALPIEEQLSQFLDSRADVVIGTPTALRRISYAIEDSGRNPKQPHIVFGAGELLDSETSEVVKRVFGIEPVGLYGQTEVGYVAWQCEMRRAFHLNADTHLVEVLADGRHVGPGELGTIVITDLYAGTMPFIRYDTKDLAMAASSNCPCGRQLPIIASIEGRASGSVLLEDGRIFTTRKIINQIAETLRLGEYRLHQEDLDRFRVELVSDIGNRNKRGVLSKVDGNLEAAVLRALHEIFGDVEISCRTVNR
ncbi:MAG: phenylacetate--CoA ligase family protein, partial [Thermodesulfobacteriota bacterium]